MQRFRVDLKTFLGLAMPNHTMLPCCHKVNIWLVWLVGFLSKKPQTLMISICSTTVLYDTQLSEVLT